jgi:DNA-directed RNA polymerase subunit M/transcription elongation factor TFIIS
MDAFFDLTSHEEYYCTHCGAVLNNQSGFESGNSAWSCTECGQVLYGDDVNEGDAFSGVMWYCDKCGALLNKQGGFNDRCGSWICAECGHSNAISEDAILENESNNTAAAPSKQPGSGDGGWNIFSMAQQLSGAVVESAAKYADQIGSLTQAAYDGAQKAVTDTTWTQQLPSFTSVVETAAQLPIVHVDRTEFLTRNLSKLCTPQQLQKAVADGTLRAGIPTAILDSVANAVINEETLKVTSISAAAGLPGGFAMAATLPADLAQFYGFVIRVAQELAYIYGWDEIFTERSNLDAGTESQLILFIGVMSGVQSAVNVVGKLFGETAMRSVAKKVAAQTLTKTWYYPIVKKIAAMLGQKMTKATFGQAVSKVVPVLGAVVSGGLTWATFKPMAHRLQEHLSTLAHMSPEKYTEYEAAIAIDSEDSELDLA